MGTTSERSITNMMNSDRDISISRPSNLYDGKAPQFKHCSTDCLTSKADLIRAINKCLKRVAEFKRGPQFQTTFDGLSHVEGGSYSRHGHCLKMSSIDLQRTDASRYYSMLSASRERIGTLWPAGSIKPKGGGGVRKFTSVDRIIRESPEYN